MKFIHTKTNKRKSISLLIVPQTKEIKQIKIATWIPKVVSTLLIIVICSSVYLTWDLYKAHTQLIEEYNTKVSRLETLEVLNLKQKDEINDLRMKTVEVEQKLISVATLQETVKKLVGLSTSEDDNGTLTASSRNGIAFSRTNTILAEDDASFDIHIAELSKQLDQSSDELSKLISDVEERLKYLDAKPNLMPTNGELTSPYGYRNNPFGGGREFHSGIDIANTYGTKIKAAGSGVVTFAGYNGSYGRMIIISHGYGYQSIYGHNKKLLVQVGDKVEKGQEICEMGSTGRSTGTHLHFEVRLYGKPINPFDVLNNNN